MNRIYSSEFFTLPRAQDIYSDERRPIPRDVLVYEWTRTNDMSTLTNVPGITPDIASVLDDNDIQYSSQLIGIALAQPYVDQDNDIEQFMGKLLEMGIVDDSGLITQSIWRIIGEKFPRVGYFEDAQDETFGEKGEELRLRLRQHNLLMARVASKMLPTLNPHLRGILRDYVPRPG